MHRAASAVYRHAGVLQITPASTDPALTDEAAKAGWNNVFRSCGRGDAEGAVAGKYLAYHYKGKKVAIVHDKTVAVEGRADEAVKAMNAKGDVTDSKFVFYVWKNGTYAEM